MVHVSARPAEAGDRAVPGHWEGDLIEGKGGRSHIGTLVERSTRFTMLVPLPAGKTAPAFAAALTPVIAGLPGALRRSLTWDQGKEMTRHAAFTLETGLPVYFADPHSPWQRGTNENTNGLIRYYYPKGKTDFRAITQAQLDDTARKLNTRPRRTLGYATPAEALGDLLDATAT